MGEQLAEETHRNHPDSITCECGKLVSDSHEIEFFGWHGRCVKCEMEQEEKPIKQRLADAGYQVKRIETDGEYRGVEIQKDGERVHKTPRASVDLALELCEQAGK